MAGRPFFGTMGNRKARRAAGETMPEGECLVQVGAVICDIDGTLLPAGRSAISARTRLTLLALKSAGVRVVLATGRAPQVALAAAEKIPYDALVCAQGAAVLEAGGRPRALHTLSEQQMYALVDFCENGEWPLNFVFDEGYFAYVEYERMLRELPEDDMQRPWLFDGEDQDKHLAAMPYGACAFLPKVPCAPLGRNMATWACALCPLPPISGIFYPAGVEKAAAVQDILQGWGLAWQQAAAIGDGEGDVCLLEKAGLSAAMENGCQAAKRAARHIAPPGGRGRRGTVFQPAYPARAARGGKPARCGRRTAWRMSVSARCGRRKATPLLWAPGPAPESRRQNFYYAHPRNRFLAAFGRAAGRRGAAHGRGKDGPCVRPMAWPCGTLCSSAPSPARRTPPFAT